MSADQAAILESIRDIIAGVPPEQAPETPVAANDDVLDLTQMVNDDGSITEIKPKSKRKEAKKAELAPEPVVEKIIKKEPEPEPEPQPQPKFEPEPEPEVDSIFKEDPVFSGKSSSDDILSEIDALLNEDDDAKEASQSEKNVTQKADDIFVELAEIDRKQKELEKEIIPEPSIILPPEPAPVFEPVEEFAPINLKEEVKTMTNDVVSETSISAAKSSIASLMSKLDETKKAAPAFKSGETVEDIVSEMLKPMMKDWLDNNLPKLVNQIVEREIAKIMSNK
jgi:hypothetical protein